METTAEEAGGDFILKGSKTWITNAPIAYVAPVSCAFADRFKQNIVIFLWYGRAANGTARFGVSSLKRYIIPFGSSYPFVNLKVWYRA